MAMPTRKCLLLAATLVLLCINLIFVICAMIGGMGGSHESDDEGTAKMIKNVGWSTIYVNWGRKGEGGVFYSFYSICGWGESAEGDTGGCLRTDHDDFRDSFDAYCDGRVAITDRTLLQGCSDRLTVASLRWQAGELDDTGERACACINAGPAFASCLAIGFIFNIVCIILTSCRMCSCSTRQCGRCLYIANIVCSSLTCFFLFLTVVLYASMCSWDQGDGKKLLALMAQHPLMSTVAAGMQYAVSQGASIETYLGPGFALATVAFVFSIAQVVLAAVTKEAPTAAPTATTNSVATGAPVSTHAVSIKMTEAASGNKPISLTKQLEELGLAQYESALADQGYDHLATLQGLTKEEAGAIADDVKMKPGHKRQFVNTFGD